MHVLSQTVIVTRVAAKLLASIRTQHRGGVTTQLQLYGFTGVAMVTRSTGPATLVPVLSGDMELDHNNQYLWYERYEIMNI